MQPDVRIDYDFSVATGRYSVRALLRLSGRPAAASAGRVPLNLSLVLDRSGSMAGAKLAAARDAAALLVSRLFPEDVVSVVVYDDEVETVAPPATGGERPGLAARLREIDSGGCTNLSGGWLRGREWVAAAARAEGVNRVLLMTDGLANRGITDHTALVGLCGEARAAGITTTTIGFGADYDEGLLRAMADAGGGHTYYIERPEQAPGVFDEEIAGLLTLAAQNLTVEVRPLGEAVLGMVHHAYPAHPVPGGLRLELGDLYTREPKLLLLELVHPGAAGEVELAELRVTADVLTEQGGMERQEVRLVLRTGLDRAGHEEPEVRRELLLQGAARARSAALEAARRNDYEGGSRALREASAALRAYAPEDEAAMEEAEDLERMATACATRSVSAADEKYLHQRAYDGSRGKRLAMERYTRSGMIEYRDGDATRPHGHGRKLVVHVADVHGEWGRGFARALSRRWAEPEARYRGWMAGVDAEAGAFAAGEVLVLRVEPELWVAVALAKERAAGEVHPQVSYGALNDALGKISDQATRLGASVHMPRVACGVGGGDWGRVAELIERRICSAGIPVTVYDG